MTYQDLQALIDYHYWARDRALAAVEPLAAEPFTRDLGNSFGSVRDTVAHLYGAEWVWCARWDGESPAGLPDPSQFATLAAIREVWLPQEQKVRAALARYGELGVERVVEYRRGGQPQAQPFWQTLQHLVNHGTYHRGQITTMLRQLGAAAPEPTDLIAFYRVRANAPV